MKVAVVHPGTQHSWQTATALQDLGALDFYATSIFYKPDEWPYRVERYLPAALARRARAEFERFRHDALNPEYVRTVGLYEWIERMVARMGYRRLAYRVDQSGNRRFGRFVEAEMAAPREFAVWSYDTVALECFKAAKRSGRHRFLDRTICDWRYYREVMAGVFECHAHWFDQGPDTIDPGLIDRDDAEFELADTIVCGSAFCAETVARYSSVPDVRKKLRVLPYCYDGSLFAEIGPPRPVDRKEPVRFLFVGQIGMRKGVHHVLEAIAQLPPEEAQLTLVGQMQISKNVFARYADRVIYLPTVPRSAIPAIMARHHAMVFPSYFEGSSLSLLEGLASGLALIQTPEAGNGVTPETGIAMAKPDTELTLTAMRRVIEDRDLLNRFRANAQSEASNYTFARYRQNIAQLLSNEIGAEQPAMGV